VPQAPDHEKRGRRVEEAKEKFKLKLGETVETFVDDFRYSPFLENAALENALKAEMTKGIREPGVVIVLSERFWKNNQDGASYPLC